ncbi:MAG: hypothetical protein EBZ67_02860 [Chitinophagia bacterium]|nr:hypothetical protein [Chitinophagia bacterium]
MSGHTSHFMKTFVWIALVYVGLFCIVLAVNESTRDNISTHSFTYEHQHTIHPRKANKLFCTWECYFNTCWCKDNHVGIDKKWLAYTDIPYYTIIDVLDSMGSYTLANIIFLVIIIPSAILWMLVRSVVMEGTIRKLDRKA